jgi:hypothetical protein
MKWLMCFVAFIASVFLSVAALPQAAKLPDRQVAITIDDLPAGLRAHGAFWAGRFRTGECDAIVLAVEADDEHRAGVAIALGLTGSEYRSQVTLGSNVSDALAEAAVAKLLGTAEEIDAPVGTVGGNQRFHGAVVLVAEREDVRPHAKASVALRGRARATGRAKGISGKLRNQG